MDDINTKILRAFKIGIKESSLRRDRDCQIVNEPNGLKIIRKSTQQPWQIRFQHNIKKCLLNSGFTQIDSFCETADGNPYFISENNLYTMSDYYPYPPANLTDPAVFLTLVKDVATMHALLRQMPPDTDIPYVNRINPADVYAKNLATLKKIKKRLGSERRLSDFDVMVLKNYNFYSGLIEKSIHLLEQSGFESYTKAMEPSVCHNLLSEENMLWHQHTIYIINFTECTNDSFLFDLESLIRRYTKRLPDTPLPVNEILSTYNRYNPLTKNETDILQAFLVHPSKFIKLCGQYYGKKRNFIPKSIFLRAEQEIAQRDRYIRYISNNHIL